MTTDTPNPAIAISNLLYLYAEAIDAGDFDGAAALFARGRLHLGDVTITDPKQMTAMWRGWIKLHDGSPRTRHIISNPIIEVAADRRHADCRSVWTVVQAAPGFALQTVASGRYQDQFALENGAWHFTDRRFVGIDLMGDASEHMLRPVKEIET